MIRNFIIHKSDENNDIRISTILGYNPYHDYLFDTEVVQELGLLGGWSEPSLVSRNSTRTSNTSTIYKGTKNMCTLWLKHSKSSKIYSGKTDKKEILKLFISDKVVQGKNKTEENWVNISVGSEIKDDWQYRVEPEKFWLDASNITEAFELLKNNKDTKKWNSKDWFAAGIEASKKYKNAD